LEGIKAYFQTNWRRAADPRFDSCRNTKTFTITIRTNIALKGFLNRGFPLPIGLFHIPGNSRCREIGLVVNFNVDYKGETLSLLLIQPHKISGEVLAKRFEEQTGAKLNVTIVPYDAIEAGFGGNFLKSDGSPDIESDAAFKAALPCFKENG
jgi:sporulation protein YlmC with PRC-barrel domain